MLIGYMRVASDNDRQTTDLQRDALTQAGVDKRHLSEDKASGARDDRPGLAQAFDKERILAGLEAAKRRGKRGGRPHAIRDETMEAIREALKNGTSEAAVCRTFGVKRSTLYDALARETPAPRH